eukprot:c11362_g1_i1.p1 GENE.c11362_g1_i1~~c11362_g1_i1.p1  ORF type:complete len:672 (-),score=153.32 c11362_g1_i1:135-2150(-)
MKPSTQRGVLCTFVLFLIASSQAIAVAEGIGAMQSAKRNYEPLALFLEAKHTFDNFRQRFSVETAQNNLVSFSITFHGNDNSVVYANSFDDCTSRFLESIPVTLYSILSSTLHDNATSVTLQVQVPRWALSRLAVRGRSLQEFCSTHVANSETSRTLVPYVMMEISDKQGPDTVIDSRLFSFEMIVVLLILTAAVVHYGAALHIPEPFEEYRSMSLVSIALAVVLLVSDLALPGPVNDSASRSSARNATITHPYRPDVSAGAAAWGWMAWCLLFSIFLLTSFHPTAVPEYRLPPRKPTKQASAFTPREKGSPVSCQSITQCGSCTAFGCGYDTDKDVCVELKTPELIVSKSIILDLPLCKRGTPSTMNTQLQVLEFVGAFFPHPINNPTPTIISESGCSGIIEHAKKFLKVDTVLADGWDYSPVAKVSQASTTCSKTEREFLKQAIVQWNGPKSRAAETLPDPRALVAQLDSVSEEEYFHGTTHMRLYEKFPTAFLARLPFHRGLSTLVSRMSGAPVPPLNIDDIDWLVRQLNQPGNVRLISPNAVSRAVTATSRGLPGFLYLSEFQTLKEIISTPAHVLFVVYYDSLGVPGAGAEDFTLAHGYKDTIANPQAWNVVPLDSSLGDLVVLRTLLTEMDAFFTHAKFSTLDPKVDTMKTDDVIFEAVKMLESP